MHFNKRRGAALDAQSSSSRTTHSEEVTPSFDSVLEFWVDLTKILSKHNKLYNLSSGKWKNISFKLQRVTVSAKFSIYLPCIGLPQWQGFIIMKVILFALEHSGRLESILLSPRCPQVVPFLKTGIFTVFSFSFGFAVLCDALINILIS